MLDHNVCVNAAATVVSWATQLSCDEEIPLLRAKERETRGQSDNSERGGRH